MSVDIVCGDAGGEIGSASFFTAFFSTILIRLEGGRWGSWFPIIMNELYSGVLPAEHAAAARAELRSIRAELSPFDPDQVVWNYENLAAKPPWGNHIDPRITSLSNYFVTSGGKDLIELLDSVFEHSASHRVPVQVQ